MVVSSKGRYALRVMVELAAAPAGEYQPLARISERQGISEKYLEAIMKKLVQEGLVSGLRDGRLQSGLLAAMVFPLLLLFLLRRYRRSLKSA